MYEANLENMAPDQMGPDEDTGVTALNCGATINTTIFVTVPASTFPVSVSSLRITIYVLHRTFVHASNTYRLRNAFDSVGLV